MEPFLKKDGSKKSTVNSSICNAANELTLFSHYLLHPHMGRLKHRHTHTHTYVQSESEPNCM